MNPHQNTPEEDRLSQALTSNRSPVRSYALDEVQLKARGIQRRRQGLLAGAVAGAVLAVVVPMSLWGPDRPATTPPITPATQTPTQAPTQSARPTPSPSPTKASMVTDLGTLAHATAMRASWLEGTTMHWQGGGTSTFQLASTDGPVSSIASYHGGVVVAHPGGIADIISVFDGTGRIVAAHEGTGPIVSPDGMQTAWWWRSGGAIRVGISSGMGNGEQRIATPAGLHDVVRIAGFTSQSDLVYTVTPMNQNKGTVYVTKGAKSVELPGLSDATAVGAGDLISGADSSGNHVVVRLSDTATALWSNDSTVPSVFSPDGKYVACFAPGTGPASQVEIREARTGDLVAAWAFGSPVALDGPMAWEDASHLLAPMSVASGAQRTATVLRLGVDAVATSAGTYPADLSGPFVMLTSP